MGCGWFVWGCGPACGCGKGSFPVIRAWRWLCCLCCICRRGYRGLLGRIHGCRGAKRLRWCGGCCCVGCAAQSKEPRSAVNNVVTGFCDRLALFSLRAVVEWWHPQAFVWSGAVRGLSNATMGNPNHLGALLSVGLSLTFLRWGGVGDGGRHGGWWESLRQAPDWAY